MQTFQNSQRGFHALEIILGVVALALIGGLITWRVYTTQQASVSQQQGTSNETSQLGGDGLQTAEGLSELAQQQESSGEPTATTPPTSSASGNSSSGGASAGSGGTSASGSSGNTTPTNTTPPPTSNITRPTADFCQQKNGNNFDVWLTDNSNHSYQVWENGGFVTKNKTGTALRNYDTLQIAEVLPYNTKPSYARCSDKGGYVMVYYTVDGSPYTYNHLVEFSNVSTTQP